MNYTNIAYNPGSPPDDPVKIEEPVNFAAVLAPYIWDLIENYIGSGQMARDLATDGLAGFSSDKIREALPEATRLAADLIYTGRK